MESKRLLANILKSRPTPGALMERKIRKENKILVLLLGDNRRHGTWVEVETEGAREEGTVLCCTGRKKKVVALEDVRTIPSDTLAAAALRASYGVPDPNHDDLDDTSCATES